MTSSSKFIQKYNLYSEEQLEAAELSRQALETEGIEIVLNPFSADGGFAIEGLGGSPNVKMVPDPGTFKILPWVEETAVVICDLYMSNGELFPFAPRSILKKTLQKMADNG